MNSVAELAAALRESRGLAHKRDIATVVRGLGIGGGDAVPVGDDCAAIPDGDGWQLLAIEGFLPGFVERDPWFAGWCGVMVNLSDVAAMGGRATAVVDALWSHGQNVQAQILAGMAAASERYGVPVVGGHSNARATHPGLAVSILGRARALLSSFVARPGEVLVAAIDLRGAYREPDAHWNCATGAPAERLRGDLELLPQIAEAGLSRAAKDISQAGLLGTALMLLECSGIGATIDVDAVPCPSGVDRARWLLSTFPSFGFLLTVSESDLPALLARFSERDIAAAAIGRCDASLRLELTSGEERIVAWDFAVDVLTGCAPPLPPSEARCA